MALDMASRARGVFLALVVVLGFLAGRRGYEWLVSALIGGGAGAGVSAVVAGALYAAFAAGMVVVALRAGQYSATLRSQLPGDRAPAQLVVGFCLGAGLVGATLVAELLSGRATITGPAARPALSALGAGLLALGAVALAEELVFRLALLRILGGLTSWPAGAVLSSAVYAAVHAGTGQVGPVYFATLFCFGIVACLLTVIGRSLWLPIGAHWAWDFVSLAVFQSLRLSLVGPSWLSGFPYRFSGGLVMLIIMSLTAAGLAFPATRYWSDGDDKG